MRANGIMIHGLQLLKLHLLHCYDTHQPLPRLDWRFVSSVLKALCQQTNSGGPVSEETKRIRDELTQFCEEHYKLEHKGKLSCINMDTVLDYMTTQVITMYDNNIKQPMIEYVERFVNVRWEKKDTTDIVKGLM